ncbi:MAG TPA: class I SAM-dependent methyltransferase [Microthrixaceae bacterium]|nr:class I SAM-dependent methyltransferase [Microthrixaceae bacterium]
MTSSQSQTWADMIDANPNHSEAYIERFKVMEAEGRDLHGEARLIDALVPRGANILDAGCGPGRVGGRLAALGHRVVGVDLDPILIEEARTVHPGATWMVGDLAQLDLSGDPSIENNGAFDLIVSAGNVLPFVDASDRKQAVSRLGAHLAESARLVIGFGAGRGYKFDDFFSDTKSAGLSTDLVVSTWDLRPFREDSDFVVAVLSR